MSSSMQRAARRSRPTAHGHGPQGLTPTASVGESVHLPALGPFGSTSAGSSAGAEQSGFRRRHLAHPASVTGGPSLALAASRPTPRSARKPGGGVILRGLEGSFGSLSPRMRTAASSAQQPAAEVHSASPTLHPSPPSRARGPGASPAEGLRKQRFVPHNAHEQSPQPLLATQTNSQQPPPPTAAPHIPLLSDPSPMQQPPSSVEARVVRAETGSPEEIASEALSPSSIPSPSTYIAPPASLFALVATPDAARTGPPGSSISDHGTASAALSSGGVSSAASPTSVLIGGGGFARPAGSLHHHHQSLSSTPLPLDVDDATLLKIESPSPTLSFFAGSPTGLASAASPTSRLRKRRTNLSTMIAPSEEAEPEEEASAERGMVHTLTRAQAQHSPDQSATVAHSTTPSHRPHPTHSPSFAPTPSTLPSPLPPPAPVVLNLTLHLPPRSFSSSSSTAATTAAPSTTATTPLDSLLSALLVLLPAEQHAQLADALEQAALSLGHVVLEQAEAASASPATAAAAQTADADTQIEATCPPAKEPPVVARARAQSLFASRGSEAEAAALKAAEARLTQRNSVHAGTVVGTSAASVSSGRGSITSNAALSPGSPSSAMSSPHSSRSGPRYLLPHGDLAALLRNKRASFLSRSLHTLAVDDTNDLDTWPQDLPPLPAGSALDATMANLPHSPVAASAAGDESALTDAEEQQALQAALDQDVELDDEYGLSGFDGRVDQPPSSPPPPAHSTLHVAISPASPASPEATQTPLASPSSSVRGLSAGEDTELVAIHQATLLLERLKLEPLPSSDAQPAVAQYLLDVRALHDRILGHLARLKKLITRRHFKSRETLARKLTNITDDTQVVDWISKEFLESGSGAVTPAHGPVARRASMLALAAGAGEGATARALLTHHARAASSMVRFHIVDTTALSSASPPAPASVREVPAAQEEQSEAEETSLAAADSSIPSSSRSDWSSPFVYPLSSEIASALAGREAPSPASLSTHCSQGDLRALLDSAASSWDFDIFALNRLSDWHPVLSLGLHAFSAGEFSSLGLDLSKARNFLLAVESGYPWSNPYHNAIHAADVLQNCMFFLSAPLLRVTLRPLDALAMLTAAIIHDFLHAGQTNAFLVATGHPLAMTYNDQAVLEHQSLAEAFRVLARPECNFVASLSVEDRRAFRSAVVSMVLHTDMTRHVEAVNGLEAAVMRHRNSGTWFGHQPEEPADAAANTAAAAADRRTILDFALHAADIANPAKPLRFSLQWANLIGSEYHSQGDLERAAGLPLSAMCDRNKPLVDVQQFAFINVVVLPLFSQFAEVAGQEHLARPLAHLRANRDFYLNRIQLKAALGQTQPAAGEGMQARLRPVAARTQLAQQAPAQPQQQELATVRPPPAEPSSGATDSPSPLPPPPQPHATSPSPPPAAPASSSTGAGRSDPLFDSEQEAERASYILEDTDAQDPAASPLA